MICPYCGSDKFQSRGPTQNKKKHRFQCNDCTRWWSTEDNSSGEVVDDVGRSYIPPATMLFKEENNKGEISFKTSERITTLDELISYCKIDTVYWEVERWICNKWEVGAAPRSVGSSGQWSRESAEIVVTPLFQVKVWLRKRVIELQSTNSVQQLIEDAKAFAPQYPKVKYKANKDGLMYEVQLPDVHFGRLTWAEESGKDYDVKIAKSMVEQVIDDLLSYTAHFDVVKIIVPLGNDWFNVNSKMNTTVHGTPQQEDTRWQKTFRLGRELAVEIIDRCAAVAPVDVLIVPGNHDEEKMFYLGDALESWYHNHPHVSINNKAMKRKYYRFGSNLIGFTHGYYEKIDKLPLLMAMEAAQDWAKSRTKEWHLGDKHNKKDIIYKTDEGSGVIVRILRAIASPDAWTYDHAYVGSERAAEGFLWHPDRGLIAQFTAVADDKDNKSERVAK